MRRDLRICNTERNSRQRERVGKPHGFRVHDSEAEEEEAEDSHSYAHDGKTEMQETQEEKRSGGEFDSGIAPGDRPMTVTAAPAQKNPAQDRNVIAGNDRGAAAWTAGARVHD